MNQPIPVVFANMLNNHLAVIVIFKMHLDESGQYVPNNVVATGWAKYIRLKG